MLAKIGRVEILKIDTEVKFQVDMKEEIERGITFINLLNHLWVLQKDAGYHPDGYGTPSRVSITGSQISWYCSASCD